MPCHTVLQEPAQARSTGDRLPEAPTQTLEYPNHLWAGVLQVLEVAAQLDAGVGLRLVAHPGRRQVAAPRVHALPRPLLCSQQAAPLVGALGHKWP